MLAPRTMAFFAAHVPFRHRLSLDIVVNGMAAVTEGSGGAGRVCLWVKLSPPIRSLGDVIRTPDLMTQVPLGAQREVVITDLLKVSLLPFGPVHECDVLFLECD